MIEAVAEPDADETDIAGSGDVDDAVALPLAVTDTDRDGVLIDAVDADAGGDTDIETDGEEAPCVVCALVGAIIVDGNGEVAEADDDPTTIDTESVGTGAVADESKRLAVGATNTATEGEVAEEDAAPAG